MLVFAIKCVTFVSQNVRFKHNKGDRDKDFGHLLCAQDPDNIWDGDSDAKKLQSSCGQRQTHSSEVPPEPEIRNPQLYNSKREYCSVTSFSLPPVLSMNLDALCYRDFR